MTDQQLDEQITRAVRALAEASPEPLPLAAAVPQRRSPRPALVFAGAFAAVALIVGLVAVLPVLGRISPFGSAGPDENVMPQTLDEYWDWLTQGAIIVDGNPDLVLVNRPPPGTLFDPRDYGQPQQLLAEGSGYALAYLRMDDPISEPLRLLPPAALVGRVAGTDREVSVMRGVASSGEKYLCFQSGTQDSGGMSCSSFELDLLGQTMVLVSATGPSASSLEPGSLLFATLGPDVALVVVELSDGRRFVQEPRAGMALFNVPSPVVLTGAAIALDRNENIIAEEQFNIGP